MPKARVLHGKLHYGPKNDRKVAGVGDVVEVSDSAMENFKDILQPVVEENARERRNRQARETREATRVAKAAEEEAQAAKEEAEAEAEAESEGDDDDDDN